MAPVAKSANKTGDRKQTTIGTFFDAKKRGISKRNTKGPVTRCRALQLRKKDLEDQAKISSGQYGILNALPPILFRDLLEHTSVNTLLELALLSDNLHRQVSNFVYSDAFVPKMMNDLQHVDNMLSFKRDDRNPAYIYGRLLKQVTIIKTPGKRIKFLIGLMEKHLTEANANVWGMILTTYSDLWEFTTCARLLEEVINMRNEQIRKAVHEVLLAGHGVLAEKEVQVSKFLRNLFLDMEYSDPPAKVFWLTALLEILATPELRPKLFLLLHLVPEITDDKVVFNWNQMVSIPVTSHVESSLFVAPIANGLLSLICPSNIEGAREFSYTHGALFNFVEEVTTFPEPWNLDNFTALHIHAPILTCVSIEMRMQQELYSECGSILAGIKSMISKWGLDFAEKFEKPMMLLFQRIKTPQLRRTLLVEFLRGNTNLLIEFLQADAIGQARQELQSQSQLRALLNKLFMMVV